ncbi:MAG: hypothetical protein KDC92_07475 [Bacteroidetes bacterium]|nr:hypothetical protein [Bacteroidota bacterium]
MARLVILFLFTSIYAQTAFANAALKNLEYIQLNKDVNTPNGLFSEFRSFKFSQSQEFNFGYQKGETWLKFNVIPHSSVQSSFLTVDFAPLDSVSLFVLNENNEIISQSVLGDDVAGVKPLRNNYPAFEIFPNKNPSATYLLRIKTQSSNQFKIQVLSPAEFINKSTQSHAYYFGFYGILLCMLLYNLFVWGALNEKNNLLYAIYLVCQILVFLGLNGHMHEFITFHIASASNRTLLMSISALNVSAMLFSVNFLKLKKYNKTDYKVFMVFLIAACVFFVLATFMPYKLLIQPSSLFGAACAIVIFVMATKCYLYGNKAARFFVLAWTVYLFSVVFLVLQRFGILGNSFFIIHVAEIGAIIETLLITLALIDKMRQVTLQNKKYIDLQEEHNDRLMAKNRKLEAHAFQLSHVMRKPIANIIGLMHLTKHYDSPPKELIDKITETAHQLDNSVRSMTKELES